MTETILPGAPGTINPEPVELGRVSVLAPSGLPAEPKQWYRKPLTWIAVGAALIGVAVALMFTVGRPGAVTPSSILKSDGYSVEVALNHQQVITAMDSAGGTSSDNAVANSMFTDAALGTQGGNTEVVIGLTPQGQSLAPLAIGSLGNGEQAHLADHGKYLVIDGATGDMGNFGMSTSATSVE